MGQLLVKGHDLPPALEPVVGVKHTVILTPHHLGLGVALYSVYVLALYLHLLGNALEDIPVAMSFLELALDLFFTPHDNEIHHLPMISSVCPGLAGGRGQGRVVHGLWWCPWGFSVQGWLRLWLQGVSWKVERVTGRQGGWVNGWKQST